MQFGLTKQNSGLISCEVIRDEVEAVLSGMEYDPDVTWVERGLHDVPTKLTAALQEAVNTQQDKEYILLGYCLCGKGVCGIRSEHATMVVPRYHDCIEMLRSVEQGYRPEAAKTSYYLTGGWVEFFEEEAVKLKERYGEKRYAKFSKVLFGNYESMTLLETGGFSLRSVRPRCHAAADSLGLCLVEEKGSMRVIDKLLHGRWDEEFLIVEPGQEIDMNEFLDACERPLLTAS